MEKEKDNGYGLKMKYHFTKADGTPLPDGIFMFVLRPDTDPTARIALRAYADNTPHKLLAEALNTELEKYE